MSICRFTPALTALAALILAQPAIPAHAQATNLDKIPKPVMDRLQARFPDAVIQKWSKETEDGVVIYDLDFTWQGHKCEADIRKNGTIDNWEQEIAAADLPAAVRKSVDERYPGATLGEVMVVTRVVAGQDHLEGYEINLKTTYKVRVEITVAPGGKIVADSGKKG